MSRKQRNKRLISHKLARLVIKSLHHKRILVTGGTGYIGRHFVALLQRLIDHYTLDCEIIVLTRQSLKSSGQITYLQGDVSDFEIDGKLDYICHLATSANPQDYRDASEQMVKTIIEGAAHVAELAEEKRVRRLLFMSSGAVYGPKTRFNKPIKETVELDVDGASLYGRAKARAELICLKHEVDVVVARGFAFYGEDQPAGWGFAIADMIQEAKDKGEITVQNTATMRSFLHVNDAAVAMLYLILGQVDYSIYNLGSSNVMSVLDAANIIAKQYNVPVRTCQHAQHNYYIPNVSRLKAAFQWEEKIIF